MRLLFAALLLPFIAGAATAGDLAAAVGREIRAILPADGIGGAAVAVRIDGRTLFFNYGWADMADKRPITSDSLFNIASLRKLFEATVIAQAVQQGELGLNDPVADHVSELAQGGTIRRVTIGQLATYTSGLLLRQDYEPWPDWGYTFPEFISTLNAWKPERDLEPGQEHIYTHAGYVLLQLVLERRFAMPIGDLLEQRLLIPLGLASTVLPLRGEDGRAQLSPALMRRVVQGYGQDGAAIGAPGDQQGYYHFPGTGQMFSSARDLATFLAAHLGDVPEHAAFLPAMKLTQHPVVPYGPRSWQALAWEINHETDPPIVEKVAGLNNTSGYVGMMPAKKLGIVILANRGSQPANAVGRRVLADLARR
ncbi:MAG: serine hydrolase [Xanthobacteraceae bacterium]